MVGLRWPRKEKGIEALLGSAQTEDAVRRDGAATLRDLLVPYERVSHEDDPAVKARRKLEQDLEVARTGLCQATMNLTAVPTTEEFWRLRLELEGTLSLPDTVVGHCLPVSLTANQSSDLSPLLTGRELAFSVVPTHCLTRFIGFHLTASAQGETLRTAFVLKLSATGFPEDRDSHVLRAIVQNREGFLRILLLILMDEDTGPGTLAVLGQPSAGSTSQFLEALGIPLFEELVRAPSRHPDKIARICQLLDELTDHGKNPEIVPADFRELWQVFEDHGARGQGVTAGEHRPPSWR